MIRESGIAPRRQVRANWDKIGQTEHFVQFYESDAFLMNSLGGLLGTALASDQTGLVIATGPHRVGIGKKLKARGLNLSALQAQRQFVSLDAAETLAKIVVNGLPDRRHFADIVGSLVQRLTHAGRRVYVFSEMLTLLWAEGNREGAIRLEELWNDLGQTYPFALCCVYPLHGCAGAQEDSSFAEVCTRHMRVIPGESYTELSSQDECNRAIALLQQKALSLEAEIEHRRAVEQELEEAHSHQDELLQVLAQANESLRQEIAQRQRAEQLRINALRLLMTAQEDERRRISRGLHDQVGQLLVGMKLDLNLVNGDAQVLTRLQQTANLLCKELHDLALELRPTALDDIGLPAALATYVEEWSARTGIEVEFQVLGLEATPLACEMKTALYRVVLEALQNILKHAGAKHVTLSLQQCEGFVQAIVEDDGQGMSAEMLKQATSNQGLGVTIMRERLALLGGSLHIESTPGKGTTLFARLPDWYERQNSQAAAKHCQGR